MNKLELIKVFRDATDLTKPEAATVVDVFFNEMADELARGGQVKIRRLCSSFVKEYGAYTGRIPKTGERVKIAPKKLPFFKTGEGIEGAGGSLKASSSCTARRTDKRIMGTLYETNRNHSAW
jgi:integration host factor subunit beta